ncbi:helix-turn-helix domain-containing protein [Enterovibrio norvegicus]|uniref:helix-turn-helix domain-containing protein n=1 Tax=Enterovibrio norvegicus TaxID=188144 RepID=UPI00035D795F
MDWMIGRHYTFCRPGGGVEYEGKVLNTSELAIEISNHNSKITIPWAIFSELVAIEAGTPKQKTQTPPTKETETVTEAYSLPLLLTEQEVAKLIGMSRSFLRQSRMEGQRQNRTDAPPFIRIGRAIRYRSEDVRKWIDEHKRLDSTYDQD